MSFRPAGAVTSPSRLSRSVTVRDANTWHPAEWTWRQSVLGNWRKPSRCSPEQDLYEMFANATQARRARGRAHAATTRPTGNQDAASGCERETGQRPATWAESTAVDPQGRGQAGRRYCSHGVPPLKCRLRSALLIAEFLPCREVLPVRKPLVSWASWELAAWSTDSQHNGQNSVRCLHSSACPSVVAMMSGGSCVASVVRIWPPFGKEVSTKTSQAVRATAPRMSGRAPKNASGCVWKDSYNPGW